MSERIGCHLHGGVKGSVEHARRIGLGAGLDEGCTGGPIQMWSRNPSAWRSTKHDPKDIGKFRDQCIELSLGPIFVHGIYLMNFASADDALWERSIEALVDQLIVGAQLGAKAIVVHPGSGGTQDPERALDRCAQAVKRALDLTESLPDRPLVGLETCAGAGKTIGRTFEELAALLARLDWHSGAAIVLDTAHMWGSGYDLATEAGLEQTVREMAHAFPLERVVCVHANDSKVERGSQKDRHENIGQGAIGEAAFERMLAHPALRGLPWVMEVPGYDGNGPDRQNLDVLRRLSRAQQLLAVGG